MAESTVSPTFIGVHATLANGYADNEFVQLMMQK